MPDKISSGGTKLSKRLGAALLAIVIALQSGCARHHRQPQPADPPKPVGAPVTEFQPKLGHVALLTKAEVPELGFISIARNKDIAAANSSKDAFASCMSGGCSGGDLAACAAFTMVQLAVCGLVVAPIAASNGENKAEAVKAVAASMAPTIDANVIQEALRDEVIASAGKDGIKLSIVPPEKVQAESQLTKGGKPDYRPLAAKGVDTMLEVTLTQIFSERFASRSNGGYGQRVTSNLDPLLPLEMNVHVRLIKTSDNSLVFFDDFAYHGKQYKYSEWATDHGKLIVSAINKAFESLGHDISDRVFLLYPFADRMTTSEAGNCGLAALGPKDDKVGELSPLLSWQSFPRESDLNAVSDDMKQVNNVKYDLIIGTGSNGESPDVIYRREGLPSTAHKVEMTLNSNTRYFWSVRARFTLDGRQRVTEWATFCPFEQQLVVGSGLYRFYTPKV